MNEIIKKVVEYKNTKYDFIFTEIIGDLKGIINSYCFNVNKTFRDDLRQDILMTIYNAICNFKMENTCLLLEKSYEQLINKYNEAKGEVYFQSFMKKYNLKELDLVNSSKLQIIDFLYEYNLFNKENQFKKMIRDICYKKTVDIYRRKNTKNNNIIISLNTQIKEDIELIDLISDQKEEIVEKNLNIISEKDKKFLDVFIENDKLLTEAQVGKKLGVSQQAISKRLKRIKNNYNKLKMNNIENK